MAFDPILATIISEAFRSACVARLNQSDRASFESLLQAFTSVKNIRNVQLWTRAGAIQRQFINSRLSDRDLDFRMLVAQLFITNGEPNFPTKTNVWSMPPDNNTARNIFSWLNNEYIRAYAHNIYFEGNFFVIRYAANSSTPSTPIDLDSDEFADLME